MPTKFEEDEDGGKFYTSFGVPISQIHVKLDPDKAVIPDTELPQFWPDYLRFESEPITFEVKLEGDFSGLIRHCMNQTYETNTKEKTEMKMSEKMAVLLHRVMWTDMLNELGDNPTPTAREQFKRDWIEENFPGASVDSSCFLCEYARQKSKETNSCNTCSTYCPIMWNAKSPGARNSCTGYGNTGISYALSPISEILALPARNPEYDEKDSPSDYFRGYRSCLDSLARIIGDSSGTFKTVTDAYTHIYNKGKGEAHISKEAFDGMKRALAEASGKPENATISEHIEGIKTKSSGALEAYYWKSCYEEVLRKLCRAADVLYPCDMSKMKEEDVDYLITLVKDKASKRGYAKGSEEKQEELNKAYEAVGKVRNECDGFMRQLSNESGLSTNRSLKDHIDSIRTQGFEKAAKQMADELDKTFNKGRSSAYDAICKRAGVMDVGVDEIIEAIRKQGVDNFLDEHPQAKYWTKTDVDQAFRTYAAEQVRPFLDKLSKESGLRRDLDVGVHIEAIKKKAYDRGFENGKEEGTKETMDKIMNAFKK